MGIFFSKYFHFCHDWLVLQDEVEPAPKNPISTGGARMMLRSISMIARDEEIEKPSDCSSKQMKLQVSVSFKMNGEITETETASATISITPHFDTIRDEAIVVDEAEDVTGTQSSLPMTDSNLSKMKLRRSFGRSGSVVLIGHSWWKLLESTELDRSSSTSGSSSETAKSKWYRAKVKAVRVGKGLSKNAVFRKLASQHWLEAVDPGHRYGHNLRYYHALWRKSSSREPFFQWLNHGEGKDLNLDETCPRDKLQGERVRYLSPEEREAYEVILEDGKFKNKKTNQLIDTSGDGKWIFVLSTSGTLYVGKKTKGLFHHSSFLAGGAISAAGRVLVENGVLKAISRQSGHYQPTEENLNYFVSFLEKNNVNLADVDMSCMDEAETHHKRGLRRNWSQEDLSHLVGVDKEVKTINRPKSKTFHIRSLSRRLSFVLIPEKHHPFRSLSAPLNR
ncbi:unnamed protein product [Rhodiola kirilowii]